MSLTESKVLVSTLERELVRSAATIYGVARRDGSIQRHGSGGKGDPHWFTGEDADKLRAAMRTVTRLNRRTKAEREAERNGHTPATRVDFDRWVREGKRILGELRYESVLFSGYGDKVERTRSITEEVTV